MDAWAGAHWWLRLALVRNGREEISPHPFHRDPFLPPFSPTFLLGRAYAVLRMCDPPLLLQSQHCSKDQSSSGSDTVHLPVGGRRKGSWERKIPLMESLFPFTRLPLKSLQIFLKEFVSPFLSTIEILIHDVFICGVAAERRLKEQFTPLGSAALFTRFGHQHILIFLGEPSRNEVTAV